LWEDNEQSAAACNRFPKRTVKTRNQGSAAKAAASHRTPKQCHARLIVDEAEKKVEFHAKRPQSSQRIAA
jgi:hypothetical protein